MWIVMQVRSHPLSQVEEHLAPLVFNIVETPGKISHIPFHPHVSYQMKIERVLTCLLTILLNVVGRDQIVHVSDPNMAPEEGLVGT